MKMKMILFFGVLPILLLGGCEGRNVEPSSSAPVSGSAPSSSLEDESIPVIESVELPPESSSSAAEQPVAADPYPAPLLTDGEKALLESCLQLFMGHIEPSSVLSTADLNPDVVLSICLESIYINQTMTAQVLEEDDQGRALISQDLVSEEAQRLLGLTDFLHQDSALYDQENGVYAYEAPAGEESAAQEEGAEKPYSDIMGAPDDMVAYTVETEEGAFLYTCKLLRQNGIPYLQLVSITVNR